MDKIKIKKLEQEDTYIQRATDYVFEVNGKKVRVNYWSKSDAQSGDYDSDEDINETDLATLTEEEQEIFQDELNEAMFDLQVGESKELEI